MRRTFLAFIVVLIALFVSVLTVKYLETVRMVNSAKKLYLQSIQYLARSIGAAYFRSQAMFQAVLEEDDEKIQRQLENLKRNYPFIEDVKIVSGEANFDFFDFSASGTNLLLRFKLYNDDATRYVVGKIALVTFDARKLAQLLAIESIEISPTGRDFVLGLKYKFSRSTLLLKLLFITFVVSTSVVSVLLLTFTKRQLKFEEELLQREQVFGKALTALVELSEKLLVGEELERMYQTILEKAIQIVPNAQAGSVLVKRHNKYVYVAAVGYDLEELSKVVFPIEDVSLWVKGTCSIKKKSDVVSYKRNIDEEAMAILRKAGRLNEIMCSLNFAITVEGEILAQLNLDNFEREDAFGEDAVRLASLFANHLGFLISKLKAQEKILQQQKLMEYLSNHDPLTGLANRRLFEDYGEKMMALARREQKPLGVMFIDLSKFKVINDRYGHNVGDEVLKIVGARLEKTTRQSDLVARFGGDEFVLLVYGCDESCLKKLAERIIQLVEETIEVEGKVFKVSADVGFALYPFDGGTLDELIRLADMAMYEAKRRGMKVLSFGQIRGVNGRNG